MHLTAQNHSAQSDERQRVRPLRILPRGNRQVSVAEVVRLRNSFVANARLLTNLQKSLTALRPTRRAANEVDQNQHCAQDMASPCGCDLAEESVLNRIPFGGSRRVMTDCNFEPGLIGKVVQTFLVPPRTRSITAATIGLDHQTLRLGIVRLVETTPVSDGIDGQVCGVAGGRHADMTLVPFRIVNAIRCRASRRIRGKVVIVDFLAFLTPCLAIVFELAHEFLLLRVDADSRLTAGAEVLTLG